jgi:hypothetical protein
LYHFYNIPNHTSFRKSELCFSFECPTAVPVGCGDGIIFFFFEVLLPSPQVASNLSESYLRSLVRPKERRPRLRGE